jgi:HEAT repeat protein
MRIALILLLLASSFSFVGCARRDEPLQVHGHPVAYWLEELKKPDARSRQKAVAALTQVGATDQAVIPALIDALKDRDVVVRDKAVLALLNLGPAAQDAAPALEELASNDSNATVRDHASKALARIITVP